MAQQLECRRAHLGGGVDGAGTIFGPGTDGAQDAVVFADLLVAQSLLVALQHLLTQVAERRGLARIEADRAHQRAQLAHQRPPLHIEVGVVGQPVAGVVIFGLELLVPVRHGSLRSFRTRSGRAQNE